MSNRRHPAVTQSAHQTLIDPAQAVILGKRGDHKKAQEFARALLAENAYLHRVLGALLERTGPVELDDALTNEHATTLFEVERYASTDGLSNRWVAKRVKG